MALLSLMARLGSSQPVELAADHEALLAGFDLASFGAAPTKFDEADLFPLTRAHLQSRPYAEVAEAVTALGVPPGMGEAFWRVARENITVLADLEAWWTLCRDGAEPVVEPGDEDFVAQALALLPPLPFGPGTWGEWTAAVKAATGRKGRALFRPLRLALTGRETGPEMADLMPLLQTVPGKG